MAWKGRKTTPQEAKAGANNLALWVKDHPGQAFYRHGAFSQHMRERYSDARTKEGKQLKAILKGLVDDLGGNDMVSSAQRLILDNIRAKIIVILQISKFVDRQSSIINEAGELLPCLGRNYTGYSEALRRDLECLMAMANRKPSRLPTIDDLIKANPEKEEPS